MNFTKLAEGHYSKDLVAKGAFRDFHKFDMGKWRDVPIEMVQFGIMLLNDGIFRLPFPNCLFAGDHDFLDSKIGYAEDAFTYVNGIKSDDFTWAFERNAHAGPNVCLTKSFIMEAFDLGAMEECQQSTRERLRVEGEVEMNADFMASVVVDYGRQRGHEHVGTVVFDQGGEFFWIPISPVTPSADEQPGPEYLISIAMGHFAINAVLGAVACLASKSTRQDIVPAPEKLNRARAKKGKLPIYEYRKITIGHASGMPKTIAGKSIEGRASPRLHWRRGHYRTLSTNVSVPIPPTLVGLAENGFIDKDYVIDGLRNRHPPEHPPECPT